MPVIWLLTVWLCGVAPNDVECRPMPIERHASLTDCRRAGRQHALSTAERARYTCRHDPDGPRPAAGWRRRPEAPAS